jgi:signal recognition particle subunit SRP54
MKVEDVNRLLKQFDDMTTMMKRMQKMGQKGMLRQGLSGLLPGGGGFPGMPGGRRPFG